MELCSVGVKKKGWCSSVREKKCLNGGCGVPDEEEGIDRDEVDSGRFSEGETEEESLIDCGLKLRKVSFIEKVEDTTSYMLLFCRHRSLFQMFG